MLDISESSAHLHARNGLLVVDVDGSEVDAVPFSDLAAVVVSNRQVVFTQSVLTGLAEAGASLVTCDEKHHPASMMLPLVGHHAQAERFVKQAALPLPRRKRWWQSIVREKIAAQARVLMRLRGMDYGVAAMAKRVGSGDPSNVEAQASRRYWMTIFGDPDFRRGDDEDLRNARLNYGYAILRAATARALSGSGLHPSFGLHHRNKYNAFALADDMMEPFRPIVDCAVAGREIGALSPSAKRQLIECVTGRYRVSGEARSLFDILARSAQGLAAAILRGDGEWKPEVWGWME
ncbi:MAG: type II CRISPR-associated endonuclease Cas1 [Bryobacteraceae bacterium]|nr:type II CRISPR-associated endonuclease Cas1 [Bryobacteraceae bacterium]